MEMWCDSCHGYVEADRQDNGMICRYCGCTLQDRPAETMDRMRIWQDGYEIGKYVGIMETGRHMLNRYEVDVAKLNRMLASAVRLCIYAVNGHCWRECIVQEYCHPEQMGLSFVD